MNKLEIGVFQIPDVPFAARQIPVSIDQFLLVLNLLMFIADFGWKEDVFLRIIIFLMCSYEKCSPILFTLCLL